MNDHEVVNAIAGQSVTPANLRARMVLAMNDIGSVAKAGKNKDQGYAYQKAADICDAAQEAFAKHGIAFISTEEALEWPEPLTTSKGGTMFVCRARMRFTLMDTESEERIEATHTGIGFDTSDKSLNKAKTQALKYFLKGSFLIGEDEDDGDADHHEVERPKQAACPKCGMVGAIIKGKAEFGGGWLCFKKKGGCGAQFKDDPSQLVGGVAPTGASAGQPEGSTPPSIPASSPDKAIPFDRYHREALKHAAAQRMGDVEGPKWLGTRMRALGCERWSDMTIERFKTLMAELAEFEQPPAVMMDDDIDFGEKEQNAIHAELTK